MYPSPGTVPVFARTYGDLVASSIWMIFHRHNSGTVAALSVACRLLSVIVRHDQEHVFFRLGHVADSYAPWWHSLQIAVDLGERHGILRRAALQNIATG